MNNTIWVLEKKKQIVNGARKDVIRLTKYTKKDFIFQETHQENFLYKNDQKWLVKLKKRLNNLGYGNVFAKQEGIRKRKEITNEQDLEDFLIESGIDITRSYGYSGNTI